LVLLDLRLCHWERASARERSAFPASSAASGADFNRQNKRSDAGLKVPHNQATATLKRLDLLPLSSHSSHPPVIAITEARFNTQAEWDQRCGMPILVIAVVFFLIFLVMGVMGISAMVAEHRGKLFSGKWSDQPKPAKR
jgi:hypothetical protein